MGKFDFGAVRQAGIGMAERLFRECVFHHCASVPPGRMKPGVLGRLSLADMVIQVVVSPWGVYLEKAMDGVSFRGVSPCGLRQPVVLTQRFAGVGRSGRINFSFADVQSNYYWSSTTNAANTGNAWNVNLNDGNANNDNKTNTNYVWPVCGG